MSTDLPCIACRRGLADRYSQDVTIDAIRPRPQSAVTGYQRSGAVTAALGEELAVLERHRQGSG